MASVLSLRINVGLTGSLGESRDLGMSPSAPIAVRIATALVDGAGLGAVNRIWTDTRTLATATAEDIDLAGSLVDALGQAFTPARIKVMLFYARPENTTTLTISRPAAGAPFFAAALDALVLKPGGIFLLTDPSAAGIVVTATTADMINVANSAGADGIYDVVLAGAAT